MGNESILRKSILGVGCGTAMVFLLSAIAPNVSNAYAQTIPSTVTIIAVCGATPTPTAIDYGALAPNAVSADRTVNLLNAGNAPSAVTARGTAWTGGASTVMNVDATHYSTSSGTSYGSKTALSTSNAALTTIPALQTQDTFWQLQTVLTNPYVGPATQIVTLTVTCQ
jgi:hypothetical protein